MTASKSVAIIDDDRLVRSAAASLMRSFGLAASTFASAEEFLGSGPEDYGCIISDVQMPGMSGLDLQDELHRLGSTTPILLVTAYPNARIRERALAGGALDLVEKPWIVEDIIACLEGIMGPLD